MRSLALAAIAVSAFLLITPTSKALAESYCIGNCGGYSNPDYDPPELPDETGLGGYPDYASDDVGNFDDSYDEQSAVGEPVYIQPRQRRYRERSYQRREYRTERRYRRATRRVYQEPVYDRYAGRTEFCRETIEKRGHGWGRKKVKVRRCIWVRNDLVPNHRADGWSQNSGW